MPAKSHLKVVGIVLFLIGVIFIPVNFFFPHTVLAPTSVQVPHQISVPHETILGSAPSFTLNSNNYRYFFNVTIAAGLTFKMNWSSDTSLTAYIFTQNQFSNYQSNQLGFSVNCQATGSGKTGTLSYNVQDSDRYVAVINNGGGWFGGGASAQVYQFMESSISYTNQTQYTTETQIVPQNDNLYLYLGIIFMILGIPMFFIFQKAFPNKNTQSAKNLPSSEIPTAPITQESKTDFEQSEQGTMPKARARYNNLGIIGGILAFVSLVLPWWTMSISGALANDQATLYLYQAKVSIIGISMTAANPWYSSTALAFLVISGLLSFIGSVIANGRRIILTLGGILALFSLLVFAAGLQSDINNGTIGLPRGAFLFSSGSAGFFGLSYSAYLSFGFWFALVAAIVMFAARMREPATATPVQLSARVPTLYLSHAYGRGRFSQQNGQCSGFAKWQFATVDFILKLFGKL